jgi:RNA polymerase sigma-70 factor (ECF subfamily)
LRSIVLNLARDHNRRGLVSLRHRVSAEPAGGGLEEGLEVAEDQQRVIDALRSLSPGQRNCLVLRYYMELSNPEIARTLGISVNTVKTQIRRGMAALERVLERDEE